MSRWIISYAKNTKRAAGSKAYGLRWMRADTFKVYTADPTQRIVLECQGCNSTSLIEPQPAKLQIEWGEGDGCLAVA